MQQVMFALALTASQDEVHATIDAISDFFNVKRASPMGQVHHTAHALTEATTLAADVATAEAAITLDKSGLPWDERIHSGNRALNADGTWRAKRNVDAGLVTRVTKELQATLGNTGAPAAPAATAPPAAPEAAPPPPPAPANTAFTDLVTFIGQTPRCTPEWLKSVLDYFDVPGPDLQNLAVNPTLAKTVHDYIAKALA